MGTTNNSKAYRRLTTAEDRLRLRTEGSLDFFNRRWLGYPRLPLTALLGRAGSQQLIHGRNRLCATGEIMLLEKGGMYG